MTSLLISFSCDQSVFLSSPTLFGLLLRCLQTHLSAHIGKNEMGGERLASSLALSRWLFLSLSLTVMGV